MSEWNLNYLIIPQRIQIINLNNQQQMLRYMNIKLGFYPVMHTNHLIQSPLHQQRAFTVLEMLVVLVITALAGGLLLQGFTHILQLRTRFPERLKQIHLHTLTSYWFNSTILATLPAQLIQSNPLLNQASGGDNEVYHFKGTATQLSGMTIQALDADPGVPVAYAWRLQRVDEQMQLQYRGRVQDASYHFNEWQVIRTWLPSDNEQNGSYFNYYDKVGTVYQQWPPQKTVNPLAVIPQLPAMVLLNVETQRYPFSWIVAIPHEGNVIPDNRLETF